MTSPPTIARHLVLAGIVALASTSTALAEWIIVAPPMTGQRRCEMVYDRSAPIAEWNRYPFGPFETLEACEALRIEIVSRSTAPGYRERLLEDARRREKEAREAQREMRREAKNDPEAKRRLRWMPRPRRGISATCDVSVEDWTVVRCVESPR
jgi:hypothetical protein